MSQKQRTFKRALFNKIRYSPHFGQDGIHFPTQPWTFHVAVWGRRSGKTLAAAMEAIYYLAQPDKRIWVVAPSYPLAEKVFREVWKWVVLDGVLGDPAEVLVSKRLDVRGGMLIRTKWGSWIEGKSADNPNSLVGEGLDFLIIDEAAKVNAGVYQKYLEPTLLDRQGKCLMITTPEGYNWLYELYVMGQSAEHRANGWASSHFKSQDNPHLSKEWIETKKMELGYNEVFRQEYEGSFEHHTGLVWPEFKDYLYPQGHLFNDEVLEDILGAGMLPEWYTGYRTIDIGLDNPTACLWAAVDKKHNVYIYDEYCLRETLADVHAENIKVKSDRSVFTSYISHDAGNTSQTDGRSVQQIYADRGIHTYPVRPDRIASIQIVARYFRSSLEDRPVHPRLLIHESCGGLRSEIQQYVWDTYANMQEKEAPDRPRKYKDDRVDALRNLLQMEPKYYESFGQMELDLAKPKYPRPSDGRPTVGL